MTRKLHSGTDSDTYTGTLTNAHIAAAVQQAEALLSGRHTDTKKLLSIRLGVEEALLRYQTAFGETTSFSLRCVRFLGRKKLCLTVNGTVFDPFRRTEEDEENVFMRTMLANLGELPAWRHAHGQNILVYTLEKATVPDWLRLLIAVALAVALGYPARLLPDTVLSVLLDDILAPALDAFLAVLNSVAGPMVFLSVVWGIISTGDTHVFSHHGKKLGAMFFSALGIGILMTSALSLPFFRLTFGSTSLGGAFSSLYAMLLDIIPKDIVSPFLEGNSLQILFEAVVFGVIMILIEEKTRGIASLVEQLNGIAQRLMQIVGKLVPYFIFTSLFRILASGQPDDLGAAGKFFSGTMLGCTFLLLCHTLVTCLRLRIRPMLLWRKAFPVFLIGLTSASSSAAFSENLSVCTKRMGVDEKLANFGVPFGQILYKPGVAVVFFMAAISVAERTGTAVSLAWLLIAIFISIVLSAATPPIPGGTTASFAIIFSQLGLPGEDLAVVLALNIVLDFFHTATNLFCGQCVLLLSAERLERLDHKILQSD